MALTPELQAKLRNVVNLPSPPRVAMKIVELAEDPDPDLGTVAKVLSMDPALTAKILRIANSALYARRRKSENMRQALILMGLNASLTLALSFSLATSLRNDRPKALDYGLYWRRALLSAISARTLGQMLGRYDGEELFLAALLQDIGMLVIDRIAPDAYARLTEIQADHERVVALEREKLGVDHAELGAWLLESWSMPDFLRIAVQHSHDPKATDTDSKFDGFSRCVSASGLLADVWMDSHNGMQINHAAEAAAKHFDMDRAAVGELLEKVREQIPDTEAVFQASVIEESEAALVMERAKDILMVRNLQALQDVSALRETADSLESRAQELEEVSRRDKLTGVFNRAHLDETLHTEFGAAGDNSWPLTVLFADLDRFKLVNDTFGHQAGDTVLRHAAELLLASTRDSDTVARYGGEEFVVVLPGISREPARLVANRILKAFQQARHALGDGPGITVTVSIGLATLDERCPFPSVEHLVAAADKAVYAAKVQGRNRVVVFGDTDGRTETELRVVS